MKNFFRQVFFILLRGSISFVILFFLFRRIEIGQTIEALRLCRIDYLLYSFFIFFVVYMLCFLRWRVLLKSAGINASLGKLTSLYSGSLFFNLFLPATIGGDIMRVLDLSSHTKKAKEVAATVLLDRLSGFVAMVLMGFLSIVLGWKYIEKCSLLVPALVVCVLVFVLITIFFTKNLFNKIIRLLPHVSLRLKLVKLHEEVFAFRGRFDVLIKIMFLSLLGQVVYILSNYYVFMALGLKLAMLNLFIFIPMVNLIAIIPISIGGLGLRDMGNAFFFALVNVANNIAVGASLLIFFYNFALGILGGIFYVFTLYFRRVQRNKPGPFLKSS